MTVNEDGIGSRVISGAKETAKQRCEPPPSKAFPPSLKRVLESLDIRSIRQRNRVPKRLGPACLRKAVGLSHDIAEPVPKGCCVLAPQAIGRGAQLPFLRQSAPTNPGPRLLQGLSRKPQQIRDVSKRHFKLDALALLGI